MRVTQDLGIWSVRDRNQPSKDAMMTRDRVRVVVWALTLALAAASAARAFAENGPGPQIAQAAAPDQSTPPNPGSQHKAKPRRARLSAAETAERRITDLHRRLKITPAEDADWAKVAEVMRENAQTMDAAVSERAHGLTIMNAVDNLSSFQKMAQVHADGLGKLTLAFKTLYDGMSDDQKKNADAVFRRGQPRAR